MRECRVQNGSTLLEAIIAVAILSTAALALAGLTSVAIQAAGLARDRTVAASFAAAKLDQLLAQPARPQTSAEDSADHNQSGFFEYLDGPGVVVGTSAARGAVFIRRWAVTRWPALPGVYRLQVSVSRCGRAGDASADACGNPGRTVTLCTLASFGGP